MTAWTFLLVPSVTMTIFATSAEAMVVVPLCVPAAKEVVQVITPVSKLVPAPFLTSSVVVPLLSEKHFIAVIVQVEPNPL